MNHARETPLRVRAIDRVRAVDFSVEVIRPKPLKCFRIGVRLARAFLPLGIAARCYSCHSGVKQKGGLRLDAGALIHKGGDDGPAIIAGRSGESALVKRVLSHDDDERMPPDKIALLQRSIDGGAAFQRTRSCRRRPRRIGHFVLSSCHRFPF